MSFLPPFLNPTQVINNYYTIAQEASKETLFGKSDDFWVAVGTLALAFITTVSIGATWAVIRAEDRRHRLTRRDDDRRHQQNMYPLIELTMTNYYIAMEKENTISFAALNLGDGVALNSNYSRLHIRK
jgi:hypothetical protein